MPITPAPTTTIVSRHVVRASRMPSESMIVASSNWTVAGRAGRVPVAMMIFSAVTLVLAAAPSVDLDRVRVGEPAGAVFRIATWLRDSWLRMTSISRPIDMLGAGRQVGDGDVLLDPVALAVQLALAQAGQVEHRLAQRLRGDRAGVDADPADHVASLDHGDAAAELGRGDRGLLATGSGPDDEKIEVVHATSVPVRGSGDQTLPGGRCRVIPGGGGGSRIWRGRIQYCP